MANEPTDVWKLIVEPLERGERITKAEVAHFIRFNPDPPRLVREWIADALDGTLKGVGGAPKKGVYDKLLDDAFDPIKKAATHVRGLRKERKETGKRQRGTRDDDIEAAASLFGVEADDVRKEYEG